MVPQELFKVAPRLLIPGPIDLDPRVLAALANPVIPHYGDQWVSLYRRLQKGILRYADTTGTAYLLAASGTGAIETGVRSLTSPGDRVLVPVNGFFSERLRAIAIGSGLEVVDLKLPDGVPPMPDDIESHIKAGDVATVLLCHNETSCGALSPLEPIARVCSRLGVNILLDAVSSFAAVEIAMDKWGIDFLATASQKALEGPPGLAAAVVSDAGWSTFDRQSRPSPGWYYDLGVWRGFEQDSPDYHPQPSTMPVNIAYGLDVALANIASESPADRYRRIAKGASDLRSGLRDLGFTILADESVASPTVTCARLPAGSRQSASSLLAWLSDEHGLVLAGGLGSLVGEIIRIGHMSRIVFDDYLPELLSVLESWRRAN